MNFSYKKSITFFTIAVSFSLSHCMDAGHDLESGFGSDDSLTYQLLNHVNPLQRKRSAWTNFYTVAGGLIGTGISSTVIWHEAISHTPSEIDDASPWVYGSGVIVAAFGVCCFFAVHGVDILHSTCKKLKRHQRRNTIQ